MKQTYVIGIFFAIGFVLAMGQTASAATNLLVNPGNETGDNSGWTSSVNVKSAGLGQVCTDYYEGGDNSQCVREVGPFSYYTIRVYEGSYALHFSYTFSTSYQIVNLTDTYSDAYLDTKPPITVVDHVLGTNYLEAGCSDTYRIRVIFRDGSGSALNTYSTGNLTATCSWQEYTHTFTDYPDGTRQIYYERGGDDSETAAGAHGPAFDSAALYVGDITDPTLQTKSPADDATDASASGNLVMTFDEPVVVGTGNVIIYNATTHDPVQTIDVTSGQVTGSTTDTITINPSADLDELTSYYVLVDATAFTDTSSNPYAGISGSGDWNFTTADETNPIITASAPADDDGNVTINTNLAITFSEIVTAQTGNIVIYKASDNSVFETIDVTSAKVTGSGTATVSINPAGTFATGTNYYIKIDATAFDDAHSNSFTGITDTTTWNFSTIATPSESGSVVADNDNTYSTDNVVSLDITGTTTLGSITQMIISESPNFTGASWQAYGTSADFTLSDGDGVKAIYIKYRDGEGNESQVFVDYIIVDTVMTMDVRTLAGQSFVPGTASLSTESVRPTFTGTAEENSTITITIHSDPVTATFTVGASGEWSWTPDADLPVGEHSVTIRGTDPAGNTSAVELALQVEAAAEPTDDDTDATVPDETPAETPASETEEAVSGDTLPTTGTMLLVWGILLETALLLAIPTSTAIVRWGKREKPRG